MEVNIEEAVTLKKKEDAGFAGKSAVTLYYVYMANWACHSCAESINKVIVLHTTEAII